MTAHTPASDVPAEPSRLARRLTTADAVVIGLGAMIGAGVFVVAGPASQAAGSGMIIGLFIAGLIAYLNATTMAQLAAAYPESGGAYVYGRKLLGSWPGFLAGWGFVIGKLASCAAMALTFGYYALPGYPRWLAAGAVLSLTAINCLGIKKTAFATKILLLAVLLSLAAVIFAALAGGAADSERLKFWHSADTGLTGILQSAGLIFFAFAGYARVATLGEEVIQPRTSIPRAILIALGATFVIYSAVVVTALLTVDAAALAGSKAPLVLAVESGRFSALTPVVRIGACFASVGVLLSLMAGVSRTIFAMAANRDLPFWLSHVHPVRQTPYRAEILVGIIVASVVAVADLRSAIGFSSFAILTYYAIANLAGWQLAAAQRLWPKWMCAAGFITCVGVSFFLPAASVTGGLILFFAGTALYLVRHHSRAPF